VFPWCIATHRDRARYGDVCRIISPYRFSMPGRCWVQLCSPAHSMPYTCQRCKCTHAARRHEQREQTRCSWKSRRAALSTEPPHLRRRKTAVGSAGPSPHRSACGTVRSDCLAGWRHASSSNGEGSDIRFFTAAQPEGTCMPPNEDLGLPAPPSASGRVADRI
jgi:hypothetical protein